LPEVRPEEVDDGATAAALAEAAFGAFGAAGALAAASGVLGVAAFAIVTTSFVFPLRANREVRC